MATYTEIHLRRDSTLNWYASNPRLALGEPGIDLTLHRFKIGNGIDRWNELPYMDDDLYRQLDKVQQEAADKAQDLLNQIKANKLDADTKYNAATTEIRNTSRDLNARMSTVEGEMTETEAEVHAGLEEFNETRDQLTVRMDTIAGQTTEDTEILDARIDGKGVVHPNLGHNIRSIHQEVQGNLAEGREALAQVDVEIESLKSKDIGHEAKLSDLNVKTATLADGLRETWSVLEREIAAEVEQRVIEDEILQSQVDANAEANIRTTFELYDQKAERKAEISKERAESLRRDEDLQRQIAQNTTTVQAAQSAIEQEGRERQKSDADLAREIAQTQRELEREHQARVADSDGLAYQVSENAEGILQTVLNMRDLNARRKADLLREEQERIAKDADLQEQIASNAMANCELAAGLFQEAKERRKVSEALNAEVQQRTEHDAQQDAEILYQGQELSQERQLRSEDDDSFQGQINIASEAILRTAINLHEVSERHNIEIAREESARISADDSLHAEIEEIAEASLQDLVNLYEALERRKEALNQEIQARVSEDAALQEQISRNAEKIQQEAEQRSDNDADLQRQLDETAKATLENSLGIHQEAQQRRKSDERIEALRDETGRRIEIDVYHQLQIDEAIHAILQNSLTLSEALARRRAALIREEQSRIDEDANLQRQTDTNAEAIMRSSLNIQQEVENRRKLLDRIAEEAQERERQIQILRNEMGLLYEIPLPGLYEQLSVLQAQANQNAEANIRNTLNNLQEAEHRRRISELLREEVSLDIEADTYHQRQIDVLISAILENSVNLHSEVARRVDAIRQERFSRIEEDTALSDEINTAAEAIMHNILALNDAQSHQQEAMSFETQTRSEQDAGILEQVNKLAEANMWIQINEHERKQDFAEILQYVKSIPERPETDDEFDEMLDELYTP